jgi:hypothetical protein
LSYELLAAAASPTVDALAVCGGGVFGGAVDIWEDVEETVELDEVEEAFDDAGRSGQDDGCVGFVTEWRHCPDKRPDAGALEERCGAEVDHEVPMAAGDRAFDRFS